MMVSRALWVSLLAGFALAGGLPACATKEAPATATGAAARCYWLSNEGAGWVARPDISNPEHCFEMDSCSGGLGMSGGGCYKWSAGRDEPAIPWTTFGKTPVNAEEAASSPGCYWRSDQGWLRDESIQREGLCFQKDSCSGGMGESDGGCYKWADSEDAPACPWTINLNPPLAADIPPPMRNGAHERRSCPGESCMLGPWQAREAAQILARPEPGARIVATIPAGEWVNAEEGLYRLTPRRGVMLETTDRFAAGDVIYMVDYEGEGFFTVWRRGEILGGLYDELIRWDEQPERDDPRLGWWVELKRPNGQRGWVKDPRTFDDCRNAPDPKPLCDEPG